MTIDDRSEKQQNYLHYHLGKNDKYEYLTGEETLPPGQSRRIEQTKITCSPLWKALKDK